jgi:putative hemolysin
MVIALIEIAVIVLLVLGNGVFAMAEIAVVSARRERLSALAGDGRRGAAAAMRLADDPNRFLATVQVGITVIGILSGAFAGATLAERLSEVLLKVPALERYANPLGFAIVVIAIAYFSLVIGEIVPKRLGLRNPERVATRVSGPMAALAKIASPAITLIARSTNAVLWLLRAREPVIRPVTEEEIMAMVRTGAEAGELMREEREMVAGVFRLTDRSVRVFMTPRQEIVWLDVGDAADAVREKMAASAHSRLPLCDGDLDHLVGIVAAKDLLSRCLTGQPLDLVAAARPALFLPETATGPDALRMMEEGRHNMAMVIDESGGIEGMVTVNDFLDEITGAMSPAHQEEFERRDSGWAIDGRAGLDEVRDVTRIPVVAPEDESNAYYTLGGFVMARLGRVPEEGDEFTWEGVLFRVERMAGHRVERVLIEPQPGPPELVVD